MKNIDLVCELCSFLDWRTCQNLLFAINNESIQLPAINQITKRHFSCSITDVSDLVSFDVLHFLSQIATRNTNDIKPKWFYDDDKRWNSLMRKAEGLFCLVDAFYEAARWGQTFDKQHRDVFGKFIAACPFLVLCYADRGDITDLFGEHVMLYPDFEDFGRTRSHFGDYKLHGEPIWALQLMYDMGRYGHSGWCTSFIIKQGTLYMTIGLGTCGGSRPDSQFKFKLDNMTVTELRTVCTDPLLKYLREGQDSDGALRFPPLCRSLVLDMRSELRTKLHLAIQKSATHIAKEISQHLGHQCTSKNRARMCLDRLFPVLFVNADGLLVLVIMELSDFDEIVPSKRLFVSVLRAMRRLVNVFAVREENEASMRSLKCVVRVNASESMSVRSGKPHQWSLNTLLSALQSVKIARKLILKYVSRL